eukprot:1887466-Prymnesium_polylepis.2
MRYRSVSLNLSIDPINDRLTCIVVALQYPRRDTPSKRVLRSPSRGYRSNASLTSAQFAPRPRQLIRRRYGQCCPQRDGLGSAGPAFE